METFLYSCLQWFFWLHLYFLTRRIFKTTFLFQLSYLDSYFMLDLSSAERTSSLVLTCAYEEPNQIYLKNEKLFP